jgi:hypothetical protein
LNLWDLFSRTAASPWVSPYGSGWTSFMLDHYGIGLMFCVCSLTCSYEHDFLRCDSRHLRCYLWKVLFRMFYLVRYALMFRVIYVPGYICSGLYMFRVIYVCLLYIKQESNWRAISLFDDECCSINLISLFSWWSF